MLETGSTTVGFGADVSRKEDIDQLLDNVRNEFGNPDILITNTGSPPPEASATTRLESAETEGQISINRPLPVQPRQPGPVK